MNLPSPQRSEAIRLAVLGFLAPRQAVAIDLETLVHRVNRSGLMDFVAVDQEIVSAVAFLLNLKFIEERRAMLGSSRFFQATSAGVLAFERGTIEEIK
jgi:hypothetical protein